MTTPNEFKFVTNYYNENRGEYNFFLPANPTDKQVEAYEQERARFTYNVAIELHAKDDNWGLLSKSAAQNHGTDVNGNMFGVDTLLYRDTRQIIDILTSGTEHPVTWQEKDTSDNWFAPISSFPSNNGSDNSNVNVNQIVKALNDINSTLQMIYNKLEEIRAKL